MNSPLAEYKNERKKDKLRKEAYSFFNEKYFKKPYEDTGFLDTVERISVQKLKFFIPGRIYTWQYDPLYKDFLDFYDRRPMVLVHSQYVSKAGNLIVQGLNLNFLPESQRVQTLELFYRIYKDDLEEAEKSANNDQPGLLKQAWQFLTDWYFTIKIFNEQGKIGYQWAYRNYIIPRIKQPVIIELEDWTMIPYFTPKEFMGMSPAGIWTEYAKYKSKYGQSTTNKDKSKIAQRKYTKPGG
jgi:hypothetical protein